MKSLMQQALGADWEHLPPALQAHYADPHIHEVGWMNIEFPGFMRPYLYLLHLLGALVPRRGRQVPTTVDKHMDGARQRWHRVIRFPDGQCLTFNSILTLANNGNLIEFVNPLLGLEMAPRVHDGCLHYHGVRYLLRLGPMQIGVPEWLVLGHTTIRESAVDDTHFAMDFRLTHPLLGQIFRYAGEFQVTTASPCTQPV